MMAPETVVTVDHNKPTGPPPQQQQQGAALDWIKINVDYFKTPPGLLKIIELILGILCMGLGSVGWFVFVAVASFITTLVWSLVYFLSIKEVLNKLPLNWVLSELISVGVETLFYFIAFIVTFASLGGYYGYASNIAAGVFGIFNTAAYGASSYLLYQEHRNSATAPAA